MFEKIEEGVIYFVNPLRNQSKSDMMNIRMLNQDKEKLIL